MDEGNPPVKESFDDCAQSCIDSKTCNAIIYRSHDHDVELVRGKCYRLQRFYDGAYQPLPCEQEVYVANKVLSGEKYFDGKGMLNRQKEYVIGDSVYRPVCGRSPRMNLGFTEEASWEDCMKSCNSKDNCKSVIYRTEDHFNEMVRGKCYNLQRTFVGAFQPLDCDLETYVANRMTPVEDAMVISGDYQYRPVCGRSPGTSITNDKQETFQACADECTADEECMAIIYRTHDHDNELLHGLCYRLGRYFDQKFEPLPCEQEVYTANKLPKDGANPDGGADSGNKETDCNRLRKSECRDTKQCTYDKKEKMCLTVETGCAELTGLPKGEKTKAKGKYDSDCQCKVACMEMENMDAYSFDVKKRRCSCYSNVKMKKNTLKVKSASGIVTGII